MKKQILSTLILAVAIVLFNSCEKEEFTPMTEETTNELQSTITSADATTGAFTEIKLTESAGNDQIQSRSESERIFEYSGQVANNGWANFVLHRSDMDTDYDYTVTLSSISGDADLYIFGYQENRPEPFREIRKGVSTGINPNDQTVELSYVRLEDLLSTETKAIFSVYGDTHAQFHIEIYRKERQPEQPLRDSSTGDYLFGYSGTGRGQIYQFNPSGRLHATAHSDNRDMQEDADIIVKLKNSIVVAGKPQGEYILTYRKHDGIAEIYNATSGKIGSRIARYTWSKTLDKIVQVSVNNKDYLVLYDKKNGEGEFWALRMDGTLGSRTASYTNWRTTWDQIVPVTVDRKQFLLFYQKSTGFGQFYELGEGTLGTRGTAYDSWDNWDKIVPVTVSGNEYLLCYKKSGGTVATYALTSDGRLNGRRDLLQGLYDNWNLIQPFTINNVTKLMCIGTESKVYYNIKSDGTLSSSAQPFTGWNNSWKQVLPF